MRSHNQKRQARSNLLVTRARSMRHTPTRQVPLGDRYIADFFVPSVWLVVEVDGGVHRGSRAADRRRDEWLRRRGYRVVRLDAALVLRDIALVVGVLQRVVAG